MYLPKYINQINVDGQTATVTAGLVVDASLSPTITNISPTTVGVEGGALITITGNIFDFHNLSQKEKDL